LLPASSAFAYQHLFKHCFPETAGASIETTEHYLWKYGALGKARPRIAGMVCDVMTDSRMRGQGISRIEILNLFLAPASPQSG
jgi:hypothetical protein